jgi:hypothetical protein
MQQQWRRSKNKGKTGWNSVHHNNWGPPPSPLNANLFIFLNLAPYMIKLRVLVLFSLLYRQFYYISLMTRPFCKVILISCGFFFFGGFFLAMGHLASLSFLKLWNLPSSSYIYIVLLDRVKPYKFIYFYNYKNVNKYYTLTLAQSVNKFHYEIYT